MNLAHKHLLLLASATDEELNELADALVKRGRVRRSARTDLPSSMREAAIKTLKMCGVIE